jgi:hypothetical protein
MALFYCFSVVSRLDNMNSRLIECVLFSGFEVFFNISAK